MKEFIEKLIGRLEEKHIDCFTTGDYKYNNAIDKAKEIVDELAEEHKGGWIPCSERMPEEHDSLFAKYKGTSEWSIGMYEKYSDDVNVTVEYKDGTRRTKTLHTIDGVWWEDGIVPYKVIAWQPLPAPCKEGCD